MAVWKSKLTSSLNKNGEKVNTQDPLLRQRRQAEPDPATVQPEIRPWWKLLNKLRGRKGHPCPSVNKKTFAYVGRMKCGGCRSSITAEQKNQLICSICKNKFVYPKKTCCPECKTAIEDMTNPKYLHYVYYHCTKRKNPECPGGSV